MNSFKSGVQSTSWASFTALALTASACASNQIEAQNADARAMAATPASASTDTTSSDSASLTTVQISKVVRERCKILDEPSAAPRFDYDQATLRATGRNVLDDVANCLIDGPLKGEVVTLVGRADARGSAGYNENLGEGRAAAARNYLAQRGVAADRMRVISRGEQGASGNDEATYALDRRVDLELGDLQNSPILEGSMMQAETSRANSPVAGEAASYATTAEGGKAVGNASAPSGSTAPSGSGTVQGSASGSVKAGAGSK